MADFFETRVENFIKINPTNCSFKKQEKEEKRIQKKESSVDEDSDKGTKGKNFCKYNGTYGYNMNDCMTLKALIRLAKQKRGKQYKKEKVHKTGSKLCGGEES